jgi:hypothetical protein
LLSAAGVSEGAHLGSETAEQPASDVVAVVPTRWSNDMMKRFALSALFALGLTLGGAGQTQADSDDVDDQALGAFFGYLKEKDSILLDYHRRFGYAVDLDIAGDANVNSIANQYCQFLRGVNWHNRWTLRFFGPADQRPSAVCHVG